MARISRRRLLSAAPLLPLAPYMTHTLFAQHRPAKTQVYIGTYTHDMGPNNKGEGIYTAEWDAESGTLSGLALAMMTPNPSFLITAPGHAALYAVNENESDPQPDGGAGGSVTALHRSRANGALTRRNTLPSGGSDPCYLSVDRANQAVFVANYTDGTLSSYRAGGKGIEGPVSHFKQEFAEYGLGPDTKRQECPHIHCANLSPDERFLLVNDLGTDHIWVFSVDLKTAKLAPHGEPWRAKPGAGPRHTHFHPNGRWVYNINEMGASLDALEWHAESGTLSLIAEASLRDASSPADSTGAELDIDREGRFLYASHRTENTLIVFAIDPKDGSLHFVQRISSGGKNPRHFTLDPTGKWLVAANQDSANVVVFARDQHTGKLSETGRSLHVGAPVCVLFV